MREGMFIMRGGCILARDTFSLLHVDKIWVQRTAIPRKLSCAVLVLRSNHFSLCLDVENRWCKSRFVLEVEEAGVDKVDPILFDLSGGFVNVSEDMIGWFLFEDDLD